MEHVHTFLFPDSHSNKEKRFIYKEKPKLLEVKKVKANPDSKTAVGLRVKAAQELVEKAKAALKADVAKLDPKNEAEHLELLKNEDKKPVVDALGTDAFEAMFGKFKAELAIRGRRLVRADKGWEVEDVPPKPGEDEEDRLKRRADEAEGKVLKPAAMKVLTDKLDAATKDVEDAVALAKAAETAKGKVPDTAAMKVLTDALGVAKKGVKDAEALAKAAETAKGKVPDTAAMKVLTDAVGEAEGKVEAAKALLKAAAEAKEAYNEAKDAFEALDTGTTGEQEQVEKALENLAKNPNGPRQKKAVPKALARLLKKTGEITDSGGVQIDPKLVSKWIRDIHIAGGRRISLNDKKELVIVKPKPAPAKKAASATPKEKAKAAEVAKAKEAHEAQKSANEVLNGDKAAKEARDALVTAINTKEKNKEIPSKQKALADALKKVLATEKGKELTPAQVLEWLNTPVVKDTTITYNEKGKGLVRSGPPEYNSTLPAIPESPEKEKPLTHEARMDKIIRGEKVPNMSGLEMILQIIMKWFKAWEKANKGVAGRPATGAGPRPRAKDAPRPETSEQAADGISTAKIKLEAATVKRIQANGDLKAIIAEIKVAGKVTPAAVVERAKLKTAVKLAKRAENIAKDEWKDAVVEQLLLQQETAGRDDMVARMQEFFRKHPEAGGSAYRRPERGCFRCIWKGKAKMGSGTKSDPSRFMGRICGPSGSYVTYTEFDGGHGVNAKFTVKGENTRAQISTPAGGNIWYENGIKAPGDNKKRGGKKGGGQV